MHSSSFFIAKRFLADIYPSTIAVLVGTIPHASNRFQRPRTGPCDILCRYASGNGVLSMQHCTLFQVAAEPTTVAMVDPASFG